MGQVDRLHCRQRLALVLPFSKGQQGVTVPGVVTCRRHRYYLECFEIHWALPAQVRILFVAPVGVFLLGCFQGKSDAAIHVICLDKCHSCTVDYHEENVTL